MWTAFSWGTIGQSGTQITCTSEVGHLSNYDILVKLHVVGAKTLMHVGSSMGCVLMSLYMTFTSALNYLRPFYLQSQVDVVGSDRQQLADLASLLCATLQSLLRKISSDDAKQISDMIMRAIYLMLNSKSAQAGGVQEDAIMTVGVLVEGTSCDLAVHT